MSPSQETAPGVVLPDDIVDPELVIRKMSVECDKDIFEDLDRNSEEREKSDPFHRYFKWTNVLGIISSLLISGYFVFEPQVNSWFWKVTAPEQTSKYLVNLKSCKIPALYDGQSELPFMWGLDGHQNSLAQVDFNCNTVDKISHITNEKLYLLIKTRKRICCIRNISRPDLMEFGLYKLSNTCKDILTNGTDVSGSEFVLVQCVHSKNKTIDFDTHALLPLKPSVNEKLEFWGSRYKEKDELPLSVIVFVVASTSRPHAHRSLPDTMKFLEETGGFTTMDGYHSMEENVRTGAFSYSNFLPLLLGTTDPYSGNSDTTNHTFLWTRFSEEKYVTVCIDDSRKMMRMGSANPNGNGKYRAFKKQPTDYYLKPFLEAHSEATEILFMNRHIAKKHCFGKQTVTSYLLDYFLRFHKKFGDVPTFSFSYLSWPQQLYGFEALAKMDSTYLDFFQQLLQIPQIKERTAIVVMSESGGLNHRYYKTEHGAQEKLSPLLMVRLPQKLLSMHPNYAENLKINSRRVLSPIDVHKTISIFPKLFTPKRPDHEGMASGASEFMGPLPGRNMFASEIPYTRTCEDAFIPEELCLCNKSLPHNFNGRSIVSGDGTPEKYWHYVSLPK